MRGLEFKSDTSMAALTRSINAIGEAFNEFKATNDERLQALADGKQSRAAELEQKLDKLEATIAAQTDVKKKIEIEQKFMQERIEELESRANQPGRSAIEKLKDEYKTAFFEWVRAKGQSNLHEQQMHDLLRRRIEAKDVTIASGAGGGVAVPEEISREIERLELLFSPVRRLVKVVQSGSSDYKELVNIRGTTAGWVGESGTRAATATSQLREVAPTFGELYAYPQASEWSLDDIFFNVESWISEEVAQQFALQEGLAVISGNGASKPTGMLNTTPVVTDDFASPMRAAAAYEFIPSLSTSNPLAAEIKPDALIDLIYRLRAPYRAGANFVMNSVTTGSIRKLKDNNGQYLWQPSLQADQPDRLLGYSVETWEQMQDIATNAFPVAFGNFRRGYLLADRVGLRITRDNVTNVGFVRFYVRRREGGIVLNNDAIKFLRTTIA